MIATAIAAFDTYERRMGRMNRKAQREAEGLALDFVVLVPGARVPAELDADDARHAGRLAAHWTNPDYMGCPEAIICEVGGGGALLPMGTFSQGGRG